MKKADTSPPDNRYVLFERPLESGNYMHSDEKWWRIHLSCKTANKYLNVIEMLKW